MDAATIKPTALTVEPDNIPAELKALPQWVLWRFTWKSKERKWDKPPKQVNGQPASSTNPKTWATFQDVLAAYQRGGWDGIGFSPSPYDPFVFLDLDHVLTTGGFGEWSPKLRELFAGDVPSPQAVVSQLNSYAETSPSGTGVRIVCLGKLPKDHRKIGGKSNGCYDGIEFYDQKHYVTITGHRLSDANISIVESNGTLTALHQAVFGDAKKSKPPKPSKPPTATPTPVAGGVRNLDDGEILEMARDARNGAKFRQLWAGDSSSYASQSEADLALAAILAFYCGPDPQRVESLMRQSGLKRPKWDEHKAYLARTVAKAIESQSAFYGQEPAGRAWATTIVKSDPPMYKLASPFYDGHLVLNARQYLNFESIRVAALEQKRVWIPGGMAAAWRGSKDEPALAGELLKTATIEEAPIELDRALDLQQRIRDWAAGTCKVLTSKDNNAIEAKELPVKDGAKGVIFSFNQLFAALNNKATPDDRVKRLEVVEALKVLNVEDISIGRGNEKRNVKRLPPESIEGGARLRQFGEV